MRALAVLPRLLAVVLLAAGVAACAHPAPPGPQSPGAPAAASVAAPSPAARPATKAAVPQQIDFATEVRPILEARCQPCHFAGGKMYERLPFDRAATVLTLREKLFTRIKDEGEQQTIRRFLAAHPAPGGVSAGP